MPIFSPQGHDEGVPCLSFSMSAVIAYYGQRLCGSMKKRRLRPAPVGVANAEQALETLFDYVGSRNA
eukprot:1199799-Amphidinium_carterae.1